MVLRGKIDRVDTSTAELGAVGLCVIDYKSSPQAFPFRDFYHGLSLQLLSYLLVLQTHYRAPDGLPVQPAAALYMSATTKPKVYQQPPDGQVLQSFRGDDSARHKAIGIICDNWLAALDQTVEPGGRSQYFSYRLKKDGAVGFRSSSGVVTADEMTALLDHCRSSLVSLAGRIVAGDIAVGPYRLNNRRPCSHCRFAAFCRFDFSMDRYRNLAPYRRPEVLERITGISGGRASDE